MKTKRVLRTLAVGLVIAVLLFLVAMCSPEAQAAPPANTPDPQEKADIRGKATNPACEVGKQVRLSRDILAYPTKDLTGFTSLWLDTNTIVTVERCEAGAILIRIYGMMMSYWLQPGDIAGGWHSQTLFDWGGRAFGEVRTGTKVDRFQWQPSPPPSFSPSQIGPGLPPPGGRWSMIIISVTGWGRPADLGFGEPVPPTCPPCPSPPTCPPCPGPGPVQRTLAQECNLRMWPWQPRYPAPPVIGVLPVGSTVDVLFGDILGTTACLPDGTNCTNRWSYVRATPRNWTTPTVGFVHGSCLAR